MIVGLAMILSSAWLTAQRAPRLKMDAVQAGLSYYEWELRGLSFPLLFSHYLAPGTSFPALDPDWNSFTRNSGVQGSIPLQLDACWRLQRDGLAPFWKQARWETGLFYSREQVPGQSVGVRTDSLSGGNFYLTEKLYINNMEFRMLGLQLAWKQYWMPNRHWTNLQVYTGLGYMFGFSFDNTISQASYERSLIVSASGQLLQQSENTSRMADLKGTGFRLQRLQVPLGISWRFLPGWGLLTELNLGISRHVLPKGRTAFDEAHGFSLRLSHYF
jgi:hypothetical protein